jgi:hypothetical protein
MGPPGLVVICGAYGTTKQGAKNSQLRKKVVLQGLLKSLRENRNETAGPLRSHGTPGQVAPVAACDFFDIPCSSSLESSELHLPTSIVEVLRLRAINPPLSDRSAGRFAQDDGF